MTQWWKFTLEFKGEGGPLFGSRFSDAKHLFE